MHLTSRNWEGKKEGMKEGGGEVAKQGRKWGKKQGFFFFFLSKPSRKIKLPKSSEISLASCFSAPIVNARNLAVEEYLLISQGKKM